MTVEGRVGQDANVKAKPRWRWTLLAVLVAGALGGAWMLLQTPPVQPVAAQSSPVVQTVVASGQVRAPARVVLATPLGGLVKDVLAEEGDHVHQGEPLVALVDDEVLATLALARAAVTQARARLQQLREVARPLAQEGVEQNAQQMAKARRVWNRASTLEHEGGGSVMDVQDAQTALTVLQSQQSVAAVQLATSRPRGADVRIGTGQLQAALAQVQAAQARLAMMAVLAPAPGTVLSRTVEPGEVVGPASVLMVLSPDGPTQLTVQLDERNLANVMLGARAMASADAFPEQQFECTVAFLAPQVDPLRGTLEVRLDVPRPPVFLRPAMTVSVEIETGRAAGVLVVPQTAVADLATAASSVLVLEEGRVESRPVTLGLRGQGVVEVVTGLRAGELVVAPRPGLKPGARVHVAPAPKPVHAK